MNSENANSTKSNSPNENQPPPVDSYAVVRFEEKNVSATIEAIAPRNGGADITLEILKTALEKAGVCYGLLEDVLLEIAEHKLYDDEFTVAEYTPPQNGTDGTITYLFEKFTAAVPVQDEKGYVDYRELGRVRSITKGTAIANITLPIDGVPGRDVLGREIVPSPTKKAKFAVGIGTVLSLDGLTLSAAINGHIVFEKNAFVVKKTLDIKADIDFNTGNIEFIGDVIIRGNVGEGFKVISTGGNVTIDGGVFSGSLIKAVGDITIKQVANHSSLEADGNINASFCEYCNIHAKGDVNAVTLMICEVYCGGILTTKGSKSGGIVGGKATVLTGMNIGNNIGSPNYPSTVISLGDNSILSAESEMLKTRIQKIENEIMELTMIIDYLNEKRKTEKTLLPEKEELLGTSVKIRILRWRDIKVVEKRLEELEHLLENRQNLKLEVTGVIYPKTKINVNTTRYETTNEWRNVSVFVDDDNEFHFNNLSSKH
jgi:uncharacterized protein (DUF342 family)